MEQPPLFAHSNKFIRKIERTIVLKSFDRFYADSSKEFPTKNRYRITLVKKKKKKGEKRIRNIAAMKLETRSIIAV